MEAAKTSSGEHRAFPWSQGSCWEVIRCLLSPHCDTPSSLFYSIKIPVPPLSLLLSVFRSCDGAAGCDRVIPHVNPVCLGLSVRSLSSSQCQRQSCRVARGHPKACQVHRPSQRSVPFFNRAPAGLKDCLCKGGKKKSNILDSAVALVKLL